MSNKFELELFRYQEDLENISLQLKNLHNGVESFSTAIEQLKVSEEVVSCFEVICYAITGIKQSVDERIEQLIEINKE